MRASARFNKILGFSILLLITFLILEFLSFLVSHNGLLIVNEKPTIYESPDFVRLSEWRTENENWGAWHKANAKTNHKSRCFNVIYNSNEIGASDTSFSISTKKKRYVLIGDSFAEGLGVSRPDKAESIVETLAGVEIMNFGSAGNFGPVQYWILYSQLANKYTHDGLIIFFLPDNDVTDNDYSFWKNHRLTYSHANGERWRPYYMSKRLNSGREYFYPAQAMKRPPILDNSVEQFLKKYFWFSNVWRTLKHVTPQKFSKLFDRIFRPENSMFSGYFDASIEQQKAAVHFVDKIISYSDAKEILLVAIPRKSDIERFMLNAERNKQYWWRSFKNMSHRLRKPTKFIDLLDYIPNNSYKLFHACDGHWSQDGNLWAGRIISAILNK